MSARDHEHALTASYLACTSTGVERMEQHADSERIMSTVEALLQWGKGLEAIGWLLDLAERTGFEVEMSSALRKLLRDGASSSAAALRVWLVVGHCYARGSHAYHDQRCRATTGRHYTAMCDTALGDLWVAINRNGGRTCVD